MCAPYRHQLFFYLPPTNERETRLVLEQWIDQHGGTAKITGKRALNLSPLIPAGATGNRELALVWWWIHVDSEPAKLSAINARDDKLLSSGLWMIPVRERRALAPAMCYVENGKSFALPGGESFGIALITTTAHRGDDEMLAYALVTRLLRRRRCFHGCRWYFHDRCTTIGSDPRVTGDGELLAEALSVSEELSRSMEIVGADH